MPSDQLAGYRVLHQSLDKLLNALGLSEGG